MPDSIRILGKVYELPTDSNGKSGKNGWKLHPRAGGWWIAEGPNGERTRLAATRGRGRLSLTVHGIAWQAELLARATHGGGVDAGVEADLISQFPGKVGKILVNEGQSVAAGEPLLLIEAMKMEFAIKAPYAGTVKRVLVVAGQQLSPGDRFLDLEAASKAPEKKP